jgi:hypothetical protein
MGCAGLNLLAKSGKMTMDTLQYGVFSLGQIWTVVSFDGMKLGFPTRAEALDAARSMIELHQAYGTPAELLVQDELGRVSRIPPPTELAG